MYIAEEVSGFAKRLTEDGVVPRQIDLLLLGFGYAVRNRIAPPERIRRHDLTRVGAIDPDTRLAIEAVAPWYARDLKLVSPSDSRQLLDFICRVGSGGVTELKKEWEGRAKSQIELNILQLSSVSENLRIG
jgi:hypothetical protein